MTQTITETFLTTAPSARAEMLTRKPAADVFAAVADPTIAANFWCSAGSGPQQPGAVVKWDWEMYGVSADVHVREAVPT